MGKGLHKLAEYIYTRPWRFIALWLVILSLAGGIGMAVRQPMSDAITIPGTEAQRALDTMKHLFPEVGAGSGRVVFVAPSGEKLEAKKSAIEASLRSVEQVAGVSGVVSPFEYREAISQQGDIAYAQVQLRNQTGQVEQATIDGVTAALDQAAQAGVAAHLAGDLINNAPGDILGLGEVVGVLVALMVLVITLGTLVAAGLPILVAIVAVAVSMGGLLIAGQWLEINSTSPVMAVMLGLAVGIDYSLFIVSKYRRYRLQGMTGAQAAGLANGTAGNAVLFAATTVVIALAALSVVGIPFMTIMGVAGAATVAMAALVAVTLLPALLGAVGDRLLAKKLRPQQETQRPASHRQATATSSRGYGWVRLVTRHPWVFSLVSIGLVAAIAWPAFQIHLSIPSDQYAAPNTTGRQAYDAITRGFGEGYNAPLIVLVENLPAVNDETRATVRAQLQPQFEARLAAERTARQQALAAKAARVTTPDEYLALQAEIQQAQAAAPQALAAAQRTFEATVERYAKLYYLNQVGERLAGHYSDIAKVVPAVTNEAGTSGVLQVIPNSASTSPQTRQLIAWLRGQEATAAAQLPGMQLAVTGSTAMQADIDQKLAQALPVYLAVVVGLSLVILTVAFRSILVPLKATLGFLLSVVAMFGAIVMGFQWGWFGLTDAPAPIVSFVPIIAIGILFGLAMDYEFFLVSNMHEAYMRDKNRQPVRAVRTGFAAGAAVVTAAAIIMISVFAGFVFNHNATVQTIGFGLAVGILIDAFVVRMTLVPAVMTLLGRSAWWLPAWLDRFLPHISIEGEAEPTSAARSRTGKSSAQ